MLARWGEAVVAERDGDARRILHLVTEIARGLEQVSGDPTLVATVETLAGASGGRRRSLARAHRLYAEARELHERQDYASAGPLFAEAANRLAAAGSSFAVWPRFYKAVVLHYEPKYHEALRAQARLRRELPLEALIPRAYSHWMSGFGRLYLAHWQDSLEHFERARALFERTGEVENRSAMDSQVADRLDTLGRTRDAWRYHGASLAQRRKLIKWRRIQSPISQSMRNLLADDRPAVALYFADEWKMVALASGNPLSETLARVERAGVLVRLGEADGAAAELERAAAAAREIPDDVIRAETGARVAMEQARLFGETDPEGALRRLAAAEAFERRAGTRLHAVAVRLLQADIHHARGDTGAEAAALWEAVAEIERQRGDVASIDLRITYLDRLRSVLERVVSFEVDQGRPRQALQRAEEMRAPALRDELQRRGLGGRLRSLPELTAALGDGRSALVYLVLPDRLLLWQVDRHDVEFWERRVTAVALGDLVDRFGNAVRAGDDLRQAGRELAALLLPDAPPPTDALLVVVPDGPLHALPFAGLPLPGDGGGFLAERAPVVVAPGLNVHLDLSARVAAASSAGAAEDWGSVLLVTDVDFAREEFPALAPLRAWNGSAAALDGTRLLRGGGATPRAFLESFPAYRSVVFEGHALPARAESRRGGLVLAPDGPDDDGLLEPERILAATERGVATRLVVLVGCGTGSGRVSGTEGVLSLARPFLALGTPSVLASLWPVRQDDAAETALRRFTVPGADPAEVLRGLQAAELEAGSPRGGGSSWLSFQLFGSGAS